MPQPSRRRFLAITAAAALAPRAAAAAPLTHWQGHALGARATLALAHPDAAAIAARAFSEIDRLEDVFSLYRAQSALARLNAAGRLAAPPFELLECLALAGAVHDATDGAFDPSVQPLWAAHAEAHAAGAPPGPEALTAARARMGWDHVAFSPAEITFTRSGMALTLNGIAQGFIADRVARLLAAEGLTEVLIDTGEIIAPGGGGWPVRIAGGPEVTLRAQALATSAPGGTTFDAAGRAGHIIDPRTGLPAAAGWRQISVTAPSAALADALSTGFCLMKRAAMDAALARFPEARLAHLA